MRLERVCGLLVGVRLVSVGDPRALGGRAALIT